LAGKPDAYGFLRLSPDGRRVAYTTTDLWVYDAQLDIPTRLTTNIANVANPVWTNDGRSLIFSIGRAMFWTPSGGGSNPQQILHSSSTRYPWSLTRDGKHLLFSEFTSGTFNLFTAPIANDGGHLQAGTPETLAFDADNAVPSPDGKWLAYVSNAGGLPQVYVRSFERRMPAGADIQQLGIGGGPVWSLTRRELFFTQDWHIMVAPYVFHGDSLVFEKPRIWSRVRLASGPNRSRAFDLAPDGNRAIAVIPDDSDEQQRTQNHLVYVQNLFSEPGRTLVSR
jgi:Tol biopolymer transport system component